MNGKAVVVGGGITGLSIAYSLKKEGVDVSLFEKERAAGGFIRSENKGGYLIELGPNSLLNINAQLDGFCHELGLDQEKIFQSQESKSRYILKNGTMVPLPRTPKEFIFTPLLSFTGKMRVVAEPFISPLPFKKNESISQFVQRRFGKEFLNYVVDPMIEGIYAGDPETLSMEATFSRLCLLEERYGSLLKGFVKKRKEEKRDKRIDLFSFKNGMGSLTQTLAKIIGEGFENETDITSLSKKASERRKFVLTANHKGKGMTRQIEADSVVLAAPAYESAKLANHLSPGLSKQLESILYAPVIIINFGFPKSNLTKPFQGSGCLIPKKENFSLLGFRVNSNLYPGRAPEGKTILTCFLGGVRNSHMLQKRDDELVNLTLNELKTLVGVKNRPEFVNVTRHPRAIPQYDLSHHLKLEAIEKELS
ncbi:MAG: protoporphyrinogen oxidase, partial [Nitrospirae bacterium]|nr:protoporphyrinogen oxidase [Nitrospirota bacterium]